MQNAIIIPGASASSRTRGPGLMEDFLWLTADLSDEEAARIAGVSVPTLCRWRRSGARKLREQIRARLLKYVEEREKAEDDNLHAA